MILHAMQLVELLSRSEDLYRETNCCARAPQGRFLLFPRFGYYIFMTALVDIGQVTKKGSWLSNLRTADFTSHAQAFGP